METATQKWCAIFVGLGVVLICLNGLGYIHDVTPFTQFFMGLGSIFIMGSSGSDVMRSYRSESLSQIISTPENSGITDLSIGRVHAPKHYDDPSL